MELEKIDVYDKNKQRTGKTIIRDKDDLGEGEYALLTHAVIINSKKNILISKRAKDKAHYPGFWENNGGLCMAGENSLQGVIREIKEELGIDLSSKKGRLYKEYTTDKKFDDIWLFKVDINVSELKLNNEVEKAKWVTIEEYEQLNKDGNFLGYDKFNSSDYEKCIRLLNEKI